MEIFIVIVLLLIVFALWKANGILTNMQNTLFDIDSNLGKINDTMNPSEKYDEY